MQIATAVSEQVSGTVRDLVAGSPARGRHW